MTEEHAIYPNNAEGMFYAACTCGWKGPLFHTITRAMDSGEDHLAFNQG